MNFLGRLVKHKLKTVPFVGLTIKPPKLFGLLLESDIIPMLDDEQDMPPPLSSCMVVVAHPFSSDTVPFIANSPQCVAARRESEEIHTFSKSAHSFV